MMKLICAIFVLCLFSVVRSTGGGEKQERQFVMEPECSRTGGMCMARVSCPPEKVSHEGHCPNQKYLGAVCCHGVSIHETECNKLGGHCITTCPEKFVITQAQDCVDSICCPLTA